jgi:hypothetical protein
VIENIKNNEISISPVGVDEDLSIDLGTREA